MIDYTTVFTTNIIHRSKETWIECVQKTGKRNAMIIIISKGDIRGPR